MIPATWMAHHRTEDDELVGYLVPDDDQYVPVTTFGYPLTEPTDRHRAETLLEKHGLSVLADRWLLELAGRAEPITVAITEVTPEQVTVANADYGYEADIGTPFILDVPVDERLRPERSLHPW